MTNHKLSRRDALRVIGSLPILLATGALAGTREDFAAALARQPALIAFEMARAEAFAAPLTTLIGRLPPALAGVLWRNGPAEHERYGHRYGHWFDGDGMIQAFTFTGSNVIHRARILDTPKRRRETQAGERVLPAFATIPPRPEPILGPNDMKRVLRTLVRRRRHDPGLHLYRKQRDPPRAFWTRRNAAASCPPSPPSPHVPSRSLAPTT